MSQARPWQRSPYLLDPQQSGLLVVDVQTKLIPHIANHQVVTWNIRRLLDAAALCGVPAVATEQYPQGLGETIPDLRQRLSQPVVKAMFSCRECQADLQKIFSRGIKQLVVVGIEAHVCVLQTVLDLLANKIALFVPADAIGSRTPLDHDIAIQRMSRAGATITTTEAVIFEWAETSANPIFKSLSQLVREVPPTV